MDDHFAPPTFLIRRKVFKLAGALLLCAIEGRQG